MSAIWKYSLGVTDKVQTLRTPGYGRVLHVAEQGGQPCVWILCQPGEPECPVVLRTIGTGHEFPPGFTYRGTAHCDGFVWHVLEYEPF